MEDLKKYLTYAKMKYFPRLSEEAGHVLQDMYVTDRMNSKDQKISKKSTGIPITVRQLEAIIRLSEAIARIYLQTQVKVQHVEEAHRIFKISTLNAAQSGMAAKNVDAPAELMSMIRKIEEAIKRRVAIGTKISYPKLQQEMMQRYENAKAIDHVSNENLTHLGNHQYDKERRVHSHGGQEAIGQEEVINFNFQRC